MLEQQCLGNACVHDVFLSFCFLSFFLLFSLVEAYVKLFFFWQMSSDSSIFMGFVDGASRNTRNLASAAWVIFSPSSQLVASGGACLGSTTNNIAEYCAMIELLVNAISHGIVHLQVCLDSQLIVS